MKLRVDITRCVSSGQCATTSQVLFDQDMNTGVVILLNEDVPPELERAAREAAMLCPGGAISIEES